MRRTRLVAGLALLAILAATGRASGQSSRAVLDVPYITQTADLCGGAALAMVLRYWGDRAVTAEDFRSLIDSKQDGISTSALTRAVTARGWRAMAPVATGATAGVTDLAKALDLGRPPIALVEVGPNKYHYVVIVAVTERDVVLHDPASRPFETQSVERFTKAWNAAGSWALVALPQVEPRSRPAPRTLTAPVPKDDENAPVDPKCAGPIEQAVAASKAGNVKEAERLLLDATTRCPGSAAPWRELAGLHFVNSQWAEANAMAQKAVRLAPRDSHSWKILGASHFLLGNALEALRAWNQTGEPVVDSVVVSGAERTRQPVVVERLGITERELLTPSAFRRAARRAADIPAVADAVVRYVPRDDGRASVEVELNEARLYPRGYAAWGSILGRALVVHEAKVPFAGMTGSGERLDVEYGWKRNHPRWAVRITEPAPGPLPGLLVVELARSKQTFNGEGTFGSGRVIEDSHSLRVGLEDWATGRIHWNAEGRYERIEQARFLAIGAGIDSRLRNDRVALLGDVSAWRSTGAAADFQLASFTAKWRQRVTSTAGGFSAEAGTVLASRDAPLSFWAGADVSPIREAYLRAHKLLTDGVVTSPVFGRRLAFASATYERPVRSFKFGAVTAAAFLDTVKTWEGMVPGREPSHADVGVGLRFHSPKFGSVRVDVGYGLRDGSTAVSAAFVRPWPRR